MTFTWVEKKDYVSPFLPFLLQHCRNTKTLPPPTQISSRYQSLFSHTWLFRLATTLNWMSRQGRLRKMSSNLVCMRTFDIWVGGGGWKCVRQKLASEARPRTRRSSSVPKVFGYGWHDHRLDGWRKRGRDDFRETVDNGLPFKAFLPSALDLSVSAPPPFSLLIRRRAVTWRRAGALIGASKGKAKVNLENKSLPAFSGRQGRRNGSGRTVTHLTAPVDRHRGRRDSVSGSFRPFTGSFSLSQHLPFSLQPTTS